MKNIFITLLIIFAFTTVKAQWEQVGEKAFAHHQIKDHAIAVDSEGTPYVLYITKDNPSYKDVSVKRFNGTEWETVGAENIIESNQFLITSPYIKIDKDDNVYISYHYYDVSNTEKYHTIVRKFDGTQWEKIGEFTSLVSEWSHGSAFCLDSNGNPYVLYYAGDQNEVGATIIQKYDGSNWEEIPAITSTDNWIYQPGMTVDDNDNIYIAYADHGNDAYRLAVDCFNGTNWKRIGEAVTIHGAIDQMNSPAQQIVVDGNGLVHVAAITDPSWGGGAYGYIFERYYFDGTEWVGGVVEGTNGMSVSLTTDAEGTAYCAYRIIDTASHGFVEKFENNEWTPVGEQPVAEDFTLIYIAVGGNGVPFILYDDYADDAQKSSVKKFIDNSSVENQIIAEIDLLQNYPNPFNPTTEINYEVQSAGTIQLLVHNNRGELVQSLVNKRLNSGKYSVSFDGSSLNSGVYFYSLIQNGISLQTKKMIMLK